MFLRVQASFWYNLKHHTTITSVSMNRNEKASLWRQFRRGLSSISNYPSLYVVLIHWKHQSPECGNRIPHPHAPRIRIDPRIQCSSLFSLWHKFLRLKTVFWVEIVFLRPNQKFVSKSYFWDEIKNFGRNQFFETKSHRWVEIQHFIGFGTVFWRGPQPI